jgi:hypothetical protein
MYNLYMSQINLNTTPAFERALARLMRVRGIATKSEAIRVAVEEAARVPRRRPGAFRAWLARATRVPPNPAPHFKSDDDLWS